MFSYKFHAENFWKNSNPIVSNFWLNDSSKAFWIASNRSISEFFSNVVEKVEQNTLI